MKVDDVFRDIKRCFLDTAPIIYYLEQNPQYASRVGLVFERLDDGILAGVTSPITLMECLVVPYRQGLASAREAFVHFIAHGPGITFIDIDESIAMESASLRARYNLASADAFQVAVALASSCDAILTNDKTLRRVTETKIILIDELLN